MNMILLLLRKMAEIFPVLIILFAMAGCGGKSFDYHSDNEIPNSPGVFSKEAEDYTVYDSKTGWFPKESEEGPESAKNAEGKPGTGRKIEGAAVAGEESAEMKEYHEFQEWKKEKTEFKEFQEWKKSKQGAKEYQEFLEWKKWKEFKKWQENQQ